MDGNRTLSVHGDMEPPLECRPGSKGQRMLAGYLWKIMDCLSVNAWRACLLKKIKWVANLLWRSNCNLAFRKVRSGQMQSKGENNGNSEFASSFMKHSYWPQMRWKTLQLCDRHNQNIHLKYHNLRWPGGNSWTILDSDQVVTAEDSWIKGLQEFLLATFELWQWFPRIWSDYWWWWTQSIILDASSLSFKQPSYFYKQTNKHVRSHPHMPEFELDKWGLGDVEYSFSS